MRDPFTWSFPLGRLFGVAIRVHIWFVLFALGVILQFAYLPEPKLGEAAYVPDQWIGAAILVGLLFVAVLLHELGHLWAAHLVEGDTRELMLWPLGGLGTFELPRTPYALFVTTAAGPGINLFLCVLCGLYLVHHSLLPTFNPLANQVTPSYWNWAESRFEHDPQWSKAPERFKQHVERLNGKPPEPAKPAPADKGVTSVRAAEPELAYLTWNDLLVGRFFWINWLLLLFNLLPGLPLDGGRMLQAVLWSRGDYRRATGWAIGAGFSVMFLAIVASMIFGSLVLLLLAWVMYNACKAEWYQLESSVEDPALGHEFSSAYGLDPTDEPIAAPRRRRPNFIQRWLQRRAERKQQREQELREAEERRLDELLDKVAQLGIGVLTEEERRFLTRVSSRYKDRQRP